MARLIVLRFEHDGDADDFVKVDKLREGINKLWLGFTVEGMFQTPTKFHSDHSSSGWRYSEKHGWWICRDCGAPSVGYGENIKAVIFDATNLLELPSKNTLERIPTDPKVDPETGERYGGVNGSDSTSSGPVGKRFDLVDDGSYDPSYPYLHGRAVAEVSLPADGLGESHLVVDTSLRDDVVESDDGTPSEYDGNSTADSSQREEKDRGSSPVVAWPASRDE